MAKKSKKKKKQQKKQHFVQTQTNTAQESAKQTLSGRAKANKTTSTVIERENTQQKVQDAHQELVQKVLKKEAKLTALIGGSITVVLFVLWFLFEYTGLGNTVYRLIKV